MSMYHAMNGGVNVLETFFILPMLDKHPDEYPRFRDCFVIPNKEDIKEIHVLTRVGGPNRNSNYGEKSLKAHPNYIRTYDWDKDNTYGMYVFSVPEIWKEDFNLITNGDIPKISQEYRNQLNKIYPKLIKQFEQIFKQKETP